MKDNYSTNGILYLVPNLLGGEDPDEVLPQRVKQALQEVDVILTESDKAARRLLARLGLRHRIDEVPFHTLSKRTTENDRMEYLQMLLMGKKLAIISEAGVPVVADPGNELTLLAQQNRIRVRPLTGPSSPVLALMASGLNGQGFTFHGYLPIKGPQRKKAIQQIEDDSRRSGCTQAFIEAPHRNDHLLRELVGTLRPDTFLSVARELTLPQEWIATRLVSDWQREQQLHIGKVPTIFLLQAYRKGRRNG